jgi:HEAT repeat protein
MSTKTFDEVVDELGVRHRSRTALWRLVEGGDAAIPALRRGLAHANPAVRRGCCEVLDLYGDDAAAEDLLRLVDDPDPDVRWMAAHALVCERCKSDDHWAKRA